MIDPDGGFSGPGDDVDGGALDGFTLTLKGGSGIKSAGLDMSALDFSSALPRWRGYEYTTVLAVIYTSNFLIFFPVLR
jgi:hypothetical protein